MTGRSLMVLTLGFALALSAHADEGPPAGWETPGTFTDATGAELAWYQDAQRIVSQIPASNSAIPSIRERSRGRVVAPKTPK